MRFQNEAPVRAPVVVVKKKNKYTPIVWDNDAETARNTVIVGTSVALEKPYFRLTSVSVYVKRKRERANIVNYFLLNRLPTLPQYAH